MEKSVIEQHIDKSMEVLFDMLNELYDVPVRSWDDTETDMMRDIWEAVRHMCEVKRMP